jgi:signal transduction histidine kinase
LAGHVEVQEATPQILQAIGEGIGWEYGVLWQPDADRRLLSCAGSWASSSVDLTEFDADTERRVFHANEGVLGVAWDVGRPHWVRDIQQEPGFLRPELAARAGLCSAVYVPVPTGPKKERHGLLEFMSTRPREPDEDMTEMLHTVSTFVDQYLRLRAAEHQLQGLVEAGSDQGVMTELAQARVALEQTETAKVDLLATASHELRTPLTAIAGFTSTMLSLGESLTVDQKREYLEIIDGQARRLRELIDDLLTFSRVQSGHFIAEAEEVNVRSAARETIRGLGYDQVAVQCPNDLIAVADPKCVHQILVNYVENAMKYGAEPVSIEAGKAHGSIVIAVCDNGTGISEARPRPGPRRRRMVRA